jgi:hypothetical protein
LGSKRSLGWLVLEERAPGHSAPVPYSRAVNYYFWDKSWAAWGGGAKFLKGVFWVWGN